MKKIVFFSVLMLMTGFAQVKAQTPKLGYVNSQKLLDLMPGATQADSAMAKYRRNLAQEYQAMASEGQKKLEEYQKNKDTWSAIVKETKQRDIQDLQNRMEQFQSNARDSIQVKRSQLFHPLLERAQKAIEAVGKEGNYDYIFDGSALLYAKDAQNILPKVKAKLGIK